MTPLQTAECEHSQLFKPKRGTSFSFKQCPDCHAVVSWDMKRWYVTKAVAPPRATEEQLFDASMRCILKWKPPNATR